MEVIGLPGDTSSEDLEDLVVGVFKIVSVEVKERDFRAIHHLANKKIVIAKLVDRKGAVNLSRNKTKQKNMRKENSIKITKINSSQQEYM